MIRLRQTRPDIERPYKVPGYPLAPVLYILGAAIVLFMLFAYRPASTWPGLAIVILGGIVYSFIKKK